MPLEILENPLPLSFTVCAKDVFREGHLSYDGDITKQLTLIYKGERYVLLDRIERIPYRNLDDVFYVLQKI